MYEIPNFLNLIMFHIIGICNLLFVISSLSGLGLRNRIAHEYFGISVPIIWDIITKELPILKEQMDEVLKD